MLPSAFPGSSQLPGQSALLGKAQQAFGSSVHPSWCTGCVVLSQSLSDPGSERPSLHVCHTHYGPGGRAGDLIPSGQMGGGAPRDFPGKGGSGLQFRLWFSLPGGE
jgi:hypothetical protein